MESNSERNQSLVEAKREYREALCDSLAIPIYEGIRSIFEDGTKDCKPEDKLVEFQLQLKKIPQWNQNIVESETKRIMGRCSQDQDYLRNLITGLMVVNTKIFSVVKLNNASTNIDLRVPGTQSFLHNCYISCAREFYKNPYLFDDSKDGEVQLKNMRESEELIRKCIVSAIRKMTPISDITRRHIEGAVDNHGEIDTNLLTSDMTGESSKKNKEDKNSESDSEYSESESEDELDDEDSESGSEDELDNKNSENESEDELDNEEEKQEEELKSDEQPNPVDVKKPNEVEQTNEVEVEELKPIEVEQTKEVEVEVKEGKRNKKDDSSSDSSSDIVLDESDIILGEDDEDNVSKDTQEAIKMTVSKKPEYETKTDSEPKSEPRIGVKAEDKSDNVKDDASDTGSVTGETIITKSNEVMKSTKPTIPSNEITRKISAKVPNFNLLTNNPHKKPKLFMDEDISDNEEEEFEEEEDEFE